MATAGLSDVLQSLDIPADMNYYQAVQALIEHLKKVDQPAPELEPYEQLFLHGGLKDVVPLPTNTKSVTSVQWTRRPLLSTPS